MANISFASKNPEVEGMVPMGRIGTVEEVASCVLWLASETASFVTGQIIAVEGGLLNF